MPASKSFIARLILGEGGAMLVLEPYDSAVKRGAKIYAEIVGFGMSADAHHITQPTVAGPVSAMRQALSDARLDATKVDYLNAHGTGTMANDSTESAAINELFGAHAPKVQVSSTANFSEADPTCNVNLIVNEARAAKAAHALSNSFAFGGLNAVLAFSRA
jgi:nodulation protein E